MKFEKNPENNKFKDVPLCPESSHKYVWLYRRERDGSTRKLAKSEFLQCTVCHTIINVDRLISLQTVGIIDGVDDEKEINGVFNAS